VYIHASDSVADVVLDNPNIGCASEMTIHFGAQYISRTRMILVVCKSLIIRGNGNGWVAVFIIYSQVLFKWPVLIDLLFGLKTCKG